mgnify:CR=1 FL=1
MTDPGAEKTAVDGLPPLRAVIDTYGLATKKSLGQNFLLDLNLTGKIARAAGDLSGATVIEVGPGPGGLTRALLMHRAARVIVIERDARCLPALEEISEEMAGQVKIVKINVDENPNSPMQLGVRGIPALFLFKGGEVVSNKIGAAPKAALQSWIQGEI